MKLNPCKNVPAAQMGPAVTRQLLAYCEGENGYTVNYMTGKKGAAAPAGCLHDQRQRRIPVR